jgi:hypothetical protein
MQSRHYMRTAVYNRARLNPEPRGPTSLHVYFLPMDWWGSFRRTYLDAGHGSATHPDIQCSHVDHRNRSDGI